jgi:hypothetical protein
MTALVLILGVLLTLAALAVIVALALSPILAAAWLIDRWFQS